MEFTGSEKAEEAATLQPALGRDQTVEVEMVGPDEPDSWGNAPPTSLGDEVEVWGTYNTKEDWDIGYKVNTMHKLLGPTTLPLTHTTGVVERSTGRIRSVAPPAQLQQPKTGKGKCKAGEVT